MEETQLELDVGNALQIQFVGDSAGQRYQARVIGYLRDQSLLVTTPRRDGRVMLLREGQILVVRMLSGNNIYGFTTSILCSCMRPYPYLHLTYPKELEKIVVRKAHRTRTNLIASVQMEGRESQSDSPISAVIVDISTTGALLKSELPFCQVGDLITISIRLRIGDVLEHLNIPALVRNVREELHVGDKPEYGFGVEFQLLDQHDSVTLHGYVYEHLINF